MNTMPLLVTLVRSRVSRSLTAAIAFALCCWTFRTTIAAESYVPFTGEKTEWHGFDRYDFVMDDNTLEITPITAPEDEIKGSRIDAKLKGGKRRCVVVAPKQPAAGNPWSWQACYWNHEPQTEVELLKRGFHIAYVAPDARGQGKPWDAWYEFLTKQHGLSKKPAFVGMSKGGVNEYNWGVAHPDCVACIYADNPAIYPEDLAKLDELAKRDVPVLQIVGTHDFLYHAGNHALAVEQRYLENGGRITMVVKEGTDHHPHSLTNAKPIADWIERNMERPAAPGFIDDTFKRSSYYSGENKFIELPEEKTYATCRGPGYTPCYQRYDAKTSSQWNIGGMTLVVPETFAAGKPWVLQCDRLERDAVVDQALLAKGFSVVVAPLEGQPGPAQKDWDATYKFMIDHGFSKTPVLAGSGAGAGEGYAWAILNPDKVSCIYAENPLLRTLTMTKTPLADGLPALAKAGIPLWHECGSRDPWLESQTRAVEKQYKELGGKITVVINEGQGHTPFAPQQVQPIVDFILLREINLRQQ